MGNAVKGAFSFEASGENYTLQYTLNGMCELEAAAGCTAMAFLKRMEAAGETDLSFGDVRLLFWAGLQEHHPDLTVRDAGRLVVAMGGVAAAMELAGKAVAASLPSSEGGGEASKGKKAKGTP